MSSKRVGKFIGATPTYGRKGSEGSRSGSWTMDQVDTQIRNGDWSSPHHIKSATLVGLSSYIGESSSTGQVQWGNNGNNMYLLCRDLDAIIQYNASTPYEITTVAPDFVTFETKNESTDPQGFHFSSNGRRLYVNSQQGPNHFNNNNDCVIQYDLTTAWDVGTASYNGRFVDTTTWTNATDNRGCYVKPDETRLYIIDRRLDLVIEFSMSPGNVGTAVTTGNSFGVGSEEGDPRDLFFSPDGLNMYVAGVQGDDVNHYTLSSAWNITTASPATPGTYQIFGGSDPVGLSFKPDGTKMWQVSNNRIYESILTVPWSFSSVSSDTTNDKYSITHEHYDLHWKPDGTRLFLVTDGAESAAAGVVSYDLGTAWDTSTLIGQTRKYFSVGSQDSNPKGVTFSDNGTYMFVNGDGTNYVYRYTLSTAWDVTTATHTQSYQYYNQVISPRACVIADGGTKFYTMDQDVREGVTQFNLSTAHDLTTMKPSGEFISFDPDVRESTASGFDISKDGKYVIMTGRSYAGILQYELREPFRLSTASSPYTLGNQYASINAQTLDRSYQSNPYSFEFNADGTSCWMLGRNNQTIHEFKLSDPWNISSMYYTNNARDISDYSEAYPNGFKWKPDGTKIYFSQLKQSQGNIEDNITQYSVKVPWDISTMTYETRYVIPSATFGNTPNMWQISFKPDGLRMFLLSQVYDNVYQFTLSTAWDVSTATYDNGFSVSSEESDPRGMEFSSDGTQLLICGNTNERIRRYDLSTAWDVTTATVNTNLEFYTDYLRTDYWGSNDGQCIRYGNDGKILYFSTDDWELYQVGLTSAYIPQTFRFAGIHTCRRYMNRWPEANPYGLAFGKDGKKVYVHGSQTNAIFEYEI